MDQSRLLTTAAEARKKHIEIITQRVWDYAASTPYNGPASGVEMLVGWPIDILLGSLVSTADRAEVYAEILRRAGGATIHTRHAAASRRSPGPTLEAMLAMRMRWAEGERTGFDNIVVHRAADKVFVWVVTNDAQAVTIEDDYALYPSDALITKLRLLQQEK